jgi:hypothetical protein
MTDIQAVILLAAGIVGSVLTARSKGGEDSLTYHVARAPAAVALDASWDGDFWKPVKSLELKHFMGERPEHFPKVQAKLVYDDHAVYVIFLVDDRFVRAVAEKHQDAVYLDSCVEFFFTPDADSAQGYFNLEMNCGGTMLFHYQHSPGQDSVPLSVEELSEIDVSHSLPKIVDPEITDPTSWTVSYRLPIDLLRKYLPARLQRPAPGVTWRANFYKCADSTSHPHWLTWSPVTFERPDFHRPQSFGTLVFE